jgi:hypothetical protein
MNIEIKIDTSEKLIATFIYPSWNLVIILSLFYIQAVQYYHKNSFQDSLLPSPMAICLAPIN